MADLQKDISYYNSGGIANTEIAIYPHLGDWPGAITHELAHVAVIRRSSFTAKTYKYPVFGFSGVEHSCVKSPRGDSLKQGNDMTYPVEGFYEKWDLQA